MKILSKTQSICPICHRPLEAQYLSIDNKVFLWKKCGEHGEFQSEVADNEEEFLKWTANPVINIPPKKAITKGVDGECPLHCGTCEEHLQTACCVLIDITNRCNQHCPYCFAKAESEDSDEPSLQEIARKLELLLELGEARTFNVQLSGGEPTVRSDLPEIISMARDKGFEYIQINTNGKRIGLEDGYAKLMKKAGASTIFLQFDGTTDEINQALRGEALLEIKKKAVENCRKAGLPVTLVPTVVKHVNLHDLGAMVDYLLDNVDVVKGIHFQPVSFFGRHPEELPFDGEKHLDFENRVTMFDIIEALDDQTHGLLKREELYPVTSGHTLCCFSGMYQKQRDGSVKSLISSETKEKGISCCEAKDPLEIIRKDRDFVLNKWDLPEEADSAERETDDGTLSFDQFLRELKSTMFSVSCMAFMDASNLDAERLKRCRVQVLSPDDRLIPFCAYNSLYRQ